MTKICWQIERAVELARCKYVTPEHTHTHTPFTDQQYIVKYPSSPRSCIPFSLIKYCKCRNTSPSPPITFFFPAATTLKSSPLLLHHYFPGRRGGGEGDKSRMTRHEVDRKKDKSKIKGKAEKKRKEKRRKEGRKQKEKRK